MKVLLGYVINSRMSHESSKLEKQKEGLQSIFPSSNDKEKNGTVLVQHHHTPLISHIVLCFYLFIGCCSVGLGN
jgi:hypothetical protein